MPFPTCLRARSVFLLAGLIWPRLSASASAPSSSSYSLAAELRGASPGDALGATLAAGAPQLLAAGATGAGGGLGALALFAPAPAWLPNGPPLAPPPGVVSPFGGAAYGGGGLALAPGVLAATVFTSYESQGGAVIFSYVGSAGVATLTQQITELSPGDMLGASLALEPAAGAWLALGAPNFNSGAGLAYLYSRNNGGGGGGGGGGGVSGNATFARTQTLSPTDFPASPSTDFGASLALSAGCLAASATSESGAGLVFLYALAAGGLWLPAQALTAGSASASGDGFGLSLALSGATLLCGAPGIGRAFVARAVAGGLAPPFAFTAPALEAPGGSSAAIAFGWAVALSSDGGAVVVVGTNTEVAGAAFVFAETGDSYSIVAALNSSLPAGPDSFGLSVAVSSDGGAIFVGAPGRGSGAGSVFVFERAPAPSPAQSGASGAAAAAAAAAGGGGAAALALAAAAAGLIFYRRRARRPPPPGEAAAEVYAALS